MTKALSCLTRLSQLLGGIERGRDIPAELGRDRLQSRERLGMTQTVTDDHEVDVARGRVLALLASRAIDERRPDTVPRRRAGAARSTSARPERLEDQPAHPLEHGRGCVGLVVLLVAHAGQP